MTQTILIVDDEARLRDMIRMYLEQEGFRVVEAGHGREALYVARVEKPDLIILDQMMPEMNGAEFMRAFGKESNTPVIMLTAKVEDQDKILGLELGADDYITKPFNMQELLLRMEVFLKRTKRKEDEGPDEFKIGNLNFNYRDLMLFNDQERQQLTQREADLLRYLCLNANRVLKREEILLNVWGKEDYFLGRSMDVFITKIRKHLKDQPGVELSTIHGIGFKFIMPTQQAGSAAAQ